jgi:hypothetical protein
MDISTQIVPVVVLLVANLMSGQHTSLRWETVTAIFGWAAGVSIIAFVIVSIFTIDIMISDYLLQVAGFSLLTALSRDYERILRPLFPWNR